MSWKLIITILFPIVAIGLLYWAWREDYIDFSWDSIVYSVKWDGISEMLGNIISQPTFVALYVFFIVLPLWILPDVIKLGFQLPLFQRILASIAGIWIVNMIMVKKGIE